MKIHHLNCVRIESPFGSAIGLYLLLNENEDPAELKEDTRCIT